jgi:hypothetical protein
MSGNDRTSRLMRRVPDVSVTQGFAVDPGCGIATDPKTVPIVINNFNRLAYLRRLVDALTSRGYENLYVIDNHSDYGPLLDYYRESGLWVFYLDANVGYLALWTTPVGTQFAGDYYVYTDADIEPVAECPDDFIAHFRDVLTRYPDADKVGFGLEVDDLPATYQLRDEVTAHEKSLLNREVEPGLYRSPVDTTFALYRPGTAGGAWLRCMRTGRPYTARHLPWYVDSAHPDAEELHYRRTARTSTHWTMLGDDDEPGVVTVMIWGKRVRVAPGGNAEHWRMVSRGEWRPDVYDALDALLEPGRTYLEIGSGLGETALYAATVAGRVVAVECDEVRYEQLARNASLNRAEPGDVVAVRACLSTRGTAADAFSALEREHPLADCALVKLDTGGGEHVAVATLVPFLRRVRPTLLVTFHPRRDAGIKGSGRRERRGATVGGLASTVRAMWRLRFYAHVCDAHGAAVTLGGLLRGRRGVSTLIFTDKELAFPEQ